MSVERLAVEAFDYLLDIELQSQPANRSDYNNLIGSSEYIHFRLGEHNFVIPIHSSSEILLNISHTRIPGAEPWLYGLANNRGKLLTLIDLNAYFSGQVSADHFGKRIIVVENGHEAYGLLIDQVFGVVHSSSLRLAVEKNATGIDKIDDLLLQAFSYGPAKLYLLDTQKFISQIQLLQV
jgi:chemotaxis signal transduction protein